MELLSEMCIVMMMGQSWTGSTWDINNYGKCINQLLLYFDLRPSPKILFQGDTPEGSDTFQWPVIERDRLMTIKHPISKIQ